MRKPSLPSCDFWSVDACRDRLGDAEVRAVEATAKPGQWMPDYSFGSDIWWSRVMNASREIVWEHAYLRRKARQQRMGQ